MKRKVVAPVLVAILGLAGVWFGGCRSDVEVPFPPSLAGNYVGLYSLLRVNGIDTLADTTNHIVLRFTKAAYNMKVDESIETDNTRFFCDVEGTYTLVNGIQFEEEDGNLTNKVCTPDDNPTGSFGLNQSTGTDTILITQDLTDDTGIRSIKTIKIVLTN